MSIETKKTSAEEVAKFAWVEAFRPTSISQMILPKQYKNFFLNMKKQNQTQNLILSSSSPGSGKTTLAKAIANDLGANYLYINASLNANVATIRDEIVGFASTKSRGLSTKNDSLTKIVILDEFDYMSPTAQASLRGLIESTYKNCRYIMTCNYIGKVIPALKEGRAMHFDFDMRDKEHRLECMPKFVQYLNKLLEFKQVHVTNENIIPALVEGNYPNARKMISLLQKYSMMNNSVIDEGILNIFGGVDESLYQAILDKDDVTALRISIENGYAFEDLYIDFYTNLATKLSGQRLRSFKKITSKYQHWHLDCISEEINFSGYLAELCEAL